MNDEIKTPSISNDSNLNQLLKCPICKQFFNEPIECLICHNNFCKECLDNFNSKNTNNTINCYFNCKDTKFILNRFLKNIIPELKNFELNQSDINNSINIPLINLVDNILNPEFKQLTIELKGKIEKEKNNFILDANSSERSKNELLRVEKDKYNLTKNLNNLKDRLKLIEQFEEIESLKNLLNKEKNKYEISKLKFEDYQDKNDEEYDDEYDDNDYLDNHY